jgi:hypothetical protein
MMTIRSRHSKARAIGNHHGVAIGSVKHEPLYPSYHRRSSVGFGIWEAARPPVASWQGVPTASLLLATEGEIESILCYQH